MFDNDYFDAGFKLAIMGLGYRGLARFGSLLKQGIYKSFVCSLEVTNNHPAFPWVLLFIQNNKNVYAKSLTANFLQSKTDKKFFLAPGPGAHLMLYNKKYFLINRVRENGTINQKTGTSFESVTFSTFSTDKKILDKILEESIHQGTKATQDCTIIFKSSSYSWEQFGPPRAKRSISSIFLAGNMKKEIVDDLKNFMKSAQWYRDRGVPYRRGYLFYGPPGSGKTSFITALAGDFNLNISLVSLNENITDDQFAQAMSCVPRNSVIIMEDIDAVFKHRSAAPDGFRHGISFSGLLNVLDGICSSEERVVFLTTNHKDRLDPALIRPGRVDVIKHFGDSTAAQAAELFVKFFPRELELAEEFGMKMEGRSMAVLQGHLLLYKESAKEALDNILEDEKN